jgi:hypothetical protein
MVVTQHSAAAGEGIAQELPGLLIVTGGPPGASATSSPPWYRFTTNTAARPDRDVTACDQLVARKGSMVREALIDRIYRFITTAVRLNCHPAWTVSDEKNAIN